MANKKSKIIALVTVCGTKEASKAMKKEFKEGNITIVVDYDKCKGAGECVTACPVQIFEVVNGKAVAKNIKECIECCACTNACPYTAIEHSSC